MIHELIMLDGERVVDALNTIPDRIARATVLEALRSEFPDLYFFTSDDGRISIEANP